MELRILERETPAGESAVNRGLYKLTDNFFKFWYAFVFENAELVEQGNGSLLYDRVILPGLSEYLGRQVFEDVCRDYLRSINGKTRGSKLPFLFSKIGRWWGTDPVGRKAVEIDILAFHQKEALFCECKWTQKQAALDILTALEEKAALFSRFSAKYYAVFSKSGFTAGLKKAAADRGDTLLIDLKTLFE